MTRETSWCVESPTQEHTSGSGAVEVSLGEPFISTLERPERSEVVPLQGNITSQAVTRICQDLVIG